MKQNLSLIKQAFLAVTEMEARLEKMEREPIAIIGLACRFPGDASNPDAFWTMLKSGIDGVRSVPSDRWDADRYYDPNPAQAGKMVSKQGGFIEGVDQFDPIFFNITPREALQLDPQQRLLLETAWEAMDYAGQPRDRQAGGRTGVFVGISTNDYQLMQHRRGDALDTYDITGNAHHAAAGRLAYIFGFQGPSVALDTACSSSLVAVHQACMSLRCGESDRALAGGVNVILTPEPTIALSQAQVLSAAGCCRTFDAAADGMVRGEGCGMLLLKRLSDAERDGDPIVALIRGSAVNQDGASSGLTVPNRFAQERVIRDALAQGGIDPLDVSYIEAHGTATPLGDPIEVGALATVYGQGRALADPLLIGSVKTNIGHLEAAAGIAGLIKLVLALKHQEIPAHLHFEEPNPHIDWGALPVRVTDKKMAWRPQRGKRLGGVSAFGFSGTNAHVILEEYVILAQEGEEDDESGEHVFTFSAPTASGLRRLAECYGDFLKKNRDLKLVDVCYTANVGRGRFDHFAGIWAHSTIGLAKKLLRFAAGEAFAGLVTELSRLDVQLADVVSGAKKVVLPSYPFERRRIWPTVRPRVDSRPQRPVAGWRLAAVRTAGGGDGAIRFEVQVGADAPSYLADHVVFGQVMLPAAAYLDLVCMAAGKLGYGRSGFQLRDMVFQKPLILGDRVSTLQVVCWPDGQRPGEKGQAGCRIELYSSTFDGADDRWVLHVTGRLMRGTAYAYKSKVDSQGLMAVDVQTHYARCAARGIEFGPRFRVIERISSGEWVAEGWIYLGDVVGGDHESAIHPVLLDGCLQILGTIGAAADETMTYLPIALGELHLLSPFPSRVRCLAQVRPMTAEDETMWVDLKMYGDGQNLLAALVGLQLKRSSVAELEAVLKSDQADWHAWLYHKVWEQTALPPSGCLLPCGGLADFNEDFAERLAQTAMDRRTAELENYEVGIQRLELLSVTIILQTLHDLGWEWSSRVGMIVSAAEMGANLGIAGRYLRLVKRFLSILAEEGILESAGDDGWTIVQLPTWPILSWSAEQRWAAEYGVGAELTMLLRCGEQMVGILRGEIDPLPLLFPQDAGGGERVISAADLYGRTLGADYVNQLVGWAVADMVADVPVGGVLRVLEIGAGTGGTTAAVLPHLAELAHSAERSCVYTFTDLSPLFGVQAKEKLSAYDFIEYRTLDIEQSLTAQQFDGVQYDLILAANVLHATSDLTQTLGHVAELMAPSGRLILLEGIAPLRFIDLIFGLTDGWWQFTDVAVRPEHPLISISKWDALLKTAGFTQTASLSDAKGILAKNGIVLAQVGADHNRSSRSWLIVTDGSTEMMAGGLSAQLAISGDVVTVSAQENFEKVLAQHRPTDVVCLLPDANRVVLDGVCQPILALVQALAYRPAQLWLVSDDVHGVVWGMGRVIAQEHPELNCRRLCVTDDHIDGLSAELLGERADDEVMLSDAGRYIPHLARWEADGPLKPVQIVANGCYLITGGVRGLGFLTAQWLVAQGAKYLLLIGRSQPSEVEQREIEALEAVGVQVQVALGDVSDRVWLEGVLAKLDQPLRGVFHAAGLLSDGFLVNQTWESFKRPFAAKVEGTWHLHTLTQDQPLDYFVLYSSVASLLGSPGQANHGVANAFMDRLAHARRAQNLPGLSVNWGAWGEVGAVTRYDMGARLDLAGIGLIDPGAGMDVLTHLLAAHATQVGVLPIDWHLYRQRFGQTVPPQLERLFAEQPLIQTAGGGMLEKGVVAIHSDRDWRAELAVARGAERHKILLAFVRTEIGGVMGLDDWEIEQSFNSLGMDSLMAIEMRNRVNRKLGVDIPIVTFLEGISGNGLIGLLDGYLLDPSADLLSAQSPRLAKGLSLTAGQLALWFLDQQAGTDALQRAAYNTAFTLRIRSAVDVAMIRLALARLVERHAVLRTFFVPDETTGQPFQCVSAVGDVHFEQHAVAELLREQVEELYRRPFDLMKGPLFRTDLLTQAADDHILLLCFHHIICDAWAIWVIVDELGRMLADDAVTLEPPTQFEAFVTWQAERVEQPELWAYWCNRLAGPLPVLDLPTDRPRSGLETAGRGASYFFKIDQELQTMIKRAAQDAGVTPFVFMLAVFQLLLHRYSGEDDLIVGSPTTGRSHADFAKMVGYLVNPIPLRADLSGDPTFRAFLQQVRQTVIDGLAHQDYPLALMTQNLPQLNRDGGRLPLFQAFFVYQKSQIAFASANNGRLQWGGMEVEPFEIAQMEGQFDVHLEVTELPNGLQGVWKYNAALWQPETIERMVAHWELLLRGATTAPDFPISQLPWFTQNELRRVTVDFNATEKLYEQQGCLHELFERQVLRTPERVALRYGASELSYRVLNERVNKLARLLRQRGVGRNTLVGIATERSLEMVVGLYAILKAGGGYVPIDPTYPADRLRFMIEDSQVPLLLTQSHLLDHLPCPHKTIVCLDALDWDEMEAEAAANLNIDVAPEDVAYMIYTSGSTGQPKGALNSHAGIVNRILWMQSAFQLGETDRVLQKTPFSFDVSVWEFFWPLMCGATLVMAKPGGHKDGGYLAQVIDDEQITTLHFVPSMLALFLDEPRLESLTKSLRRVICSGESLAFELQERFFGRISAELHNLYGPTEAAIDVTHWHCQPKVGRHGIPIGRPIANTKVFIVDQFDHPLPIGVPGELLIGGVQVGVGYWQRERLTAERFQLIEIGGNVERIYRTGDLCRWLPDGSVEYMGRLDFQVKVRGFRIELGEIEAMLLTHHAVDRAVVIAHEHGTMGVRLISYVTVSEPVSSESLRQYLCQMLPDYMLPSYFVLLDEIPLSPNGKVDRRALLALERGRVNEAQEFVPLVGQVELQVAAIWSDLLDVPVGEIGRRDNFFDLGGHSILLGQLRLRLNQQFGVQFSMVTLFSHSTVAALADYLQAQSQPVDRSESKAAVSTDRATSRRKRLAQMRKRRK